MAMMTPTLRGEFVTLRPIAVEDAEITLLWRNSARARNLHKGARSTEQQVRWITAQPVSDYNFIIELNTGKPVGMLSLINIDRDEKSAEPARFLIGDEASVRGIPAAIEAMYLLYRFAFDNLKLTRLYGTIASDNKRMVKWQKYLGMTELKRLHQHFFINQRYQDAVCMELRLDSYRTITVPKMHNLMLMHHSNPTTITTAT